MSERATTNVDDDVCPRAHPPALYHGEIEQIFPNVYFVQGTVEMKGAMPLITMTFQRAMTIIRNEKGELVLFNSLRLDDDGLKQLDALGEVKHVVRLAFFHGLDDPFYKERYPESTVWAPDKAPYFPEFQVKATPYFRADRLYSNTSNADLSPFLHIQAKTVTIESCKYPEAVVLVDRPEGRVLIAGDALQNFARTGDPHANCCSGLMMRGMGFYKPCSVGPAWIGVCKPAKSEMIAFLETHAFDHLLPVHGLPCLGKAHEKYSPAIYGLKDD